MTIYRYSLVIKGQEVYVGPTRPAQQPGATCTRKKWIPGSHEWKKGDWSEKERVF